MTTRIVVLGGLALGMVGVILVALMTSTKLTPAMFGQDGGCVATLPPTGGQPTGNVSKTLDPEQLSIATDIIAMGKQRNVPARGWQVAIQAGKVESQLHNLDHGDSSSLGVFQILDIHGTKAQRLDLTWEINWFYDHLANVQGWQNMRPGDAAQAVERSLFPDRYNAWEQWAATLVTELGNVSPGDISGCGTPTGNGSNKYADQAIKFALAQQGKPYVWGATGPESYDCSGLMLAAYKNAGLIIPRVAADQYNSGSHVPVAQAQPGDLIFWASHPNNPVTIEHVAMYLGNNEVVEAPDTGDVVKTVPIWTNGLVPQATRPGS